MRKINLGKIAGVAAAAAIMAAPHAKASLEFVIDNGNSALSGLTPPFGTVTVTRIDNSDAEITLTAAPGYSFGGQGMFGLNLAGGGTIGYTLVSATTVNSGPSITPNSSDSEDGFGSFNYTLREFDGLNYSLTSLTFDLSTTSGAWTSDAAILTPNGSGLEVVGHVFVDSGPNQGLTGYAAGTPVPEPTTVLAGILLLLPLGASTIRVMRRGNRFA
jgi:hypothetical protein